MLLLNGCDVNPASGGASPAGIEDQAKPPQNGREELISRLNSKYGENFTYIGNAGGGTMMNDHCAIYLRSERFPDDRIYAVHGVFDGKTEDRDNYMAYCLRDEAALYLTDLAKEVYGECRAFYTPAENVAAPPEINRDSTVQELLKSTKNYFSVILPEGQDIAEKDKQLDRIYEKMKGEGINCFFYIAYLNSSEIYNSAGSAEGIGREYIITDCSLGMDENFNITERQWG